MNELCIIACGKKKIWDTDASASPVKSKDMYTGSFTRKCIQYTEKFHKDSYCILSAKYGFISSEEVVEGPYNECFHLKKTNPIKEDQLLFQIENRKLNKHEKIIILGGKYYTEMIKNLFPNKEVNNPLEGCKGIGKMMRKLNELLCH